MATIRGAQIRFPKGNSDEFLSPLKHVPRLTRPFSLFSDEFPMVRDLSEGGESVHYHRTQF